MQMWQQMNASAHMWSKTPHNADAVADERLNTNAASDERLWQHRYCQRLHTRQIGQQFSPLHADDAFYLFLQKQSIAYQHVPVWVHYI
jgi:hypothetical protein